jgi:hypothetical protein
MPLRVSQKPSDSKPLINHHLGPHVLKLHSKKVIMMRAGIRPLEGEQAMEKNKKMLKQEYRQNPRPMGVFLIRNMVNDKVFVVVGLDLEGLINRYKFQLKMGKHTNLRLQSEWNEFGGDNFAFEILDQLNAPDGPHANPREDLASLEDLWLEKLQPYDERGYNERKLSREEKLRRISARRADTF